MKIPWRQISVGWWECFFPGNPSVSIEVAEKWPHGWKAKVGIAFEGKNPRAASRAALRFLKRIGWKPEGES
jgi:hypothetical protein